MRAALLAAVSYGPQKWFDPAFGGIWPAVIVAQAAIVVLVVTVLRGVARLRREDG